MSDELARMRDRLASRVITSTRTRSDRVAAALRAVPRHLFLPGLPPEAAYRDDAIVTKRDADGQGISSSSQPAIMAIMLDQLDLAPGQRVLEIGAGTGYNAALIAHIVGPSGQVVSVDIDADTAEAARAHLAGAGYSGVTVVCADGAEGYPARAPYDRAIATVGVSDLARAWLDQVTPEARIVVPLDLRGTQLSVAFGQAGTGHWTSMSLVPCGFMRMRGSLAGPERTVPLGGGLSVLLPDGLTLADGQEIDATALAAVLAGAPAVHGTEVRARPDRVLWGLGLWLAAGEPRMCRVSEGRRGSSRSVLARAPLRGRGWRTTLGMLDSGGIAVLAGIPVAPAPGQPPGAFALSAAGFGPHGSELAAGLAAHVRAWAEAGQPAAAGLRVDAYPRASAGVPDRAGGELVIERPDTRFVVCHTYPWGVTDATGDHLETEHKYDAGAGFVLPRFDGLPGVSVAGPQRHHLHATYYDTGDLALSASRVTLRRRVGGADEGWHLKLPVRTDTRQELHAPLGDGDTVPTRLSERVAGITGGRALHPIAILDTERTTLTLTGSAGQLLAEVADDSVTATRLDAAGGGPGPPLRWREIEVEAGRDTAEAPAVLDAADRLLLAAGARRSSSASKLGRLLGHRGNS